MTDDVVRSDETVQAIIHEAKRISEDTIYCYAGHSQAARRWDEINLWLGIPTTIIAAITGVTSLSSNSSSPAILGLSANVLVGVLAFLVAAISGLSTFLDPKNQASKHYLAAVAYLALHNDVRIFYQIDCLSGQPTSELAEQIKKLSARLNDLDNQPLIIPRWAQNAGNKMIKSGAYNYKIDEELKSNLRDSTAKES
jgi:hypothetical protein